MVPCCPGGAVQGARPEGTQQRRNAREHHKRTSRRGGSAGAATSYSSWQGYQQALRYDQIFLVTHQAIDLFRDFPFRRTSFDFGMFQTLAEETEVCPIP